MASIMGMADRVTEREGKYIEIDQSELENCKQHLRLVLKVLLPIFKLRVGAQVAAQVSLNGQLQPRLTGDRQLSISIGDPTVNGTMCFQF
ncbi:hypothetical protein CASFOL_020661 [Castilleja foliolosa]|uniref:Uncharacterized protein n=1 Tax=Castilleja foliolosa TaxID=1961234 RepID=A0ABD3D4E8_9LAMI